MLPKGVVDAVKELTDQHPYYPQDIPLTGYRYARLPFEHILGIFASAALVVFISSFLISGSH